jgi:hypothetical protein
MEYRYVNQQKQIPLYDGQRLVGYATFETLPAKEYAIHDCEFSPDPDEAKIGVKRGTECPYSSYGCDYVAAESLTAALQLHYAGLEKDRQPRLSVLRRIVTIRWLFGETIATGDGLESIDGDSNTNLIKG